MPMERIMPRQHPKAVVILILSEQSEPKGKDPRISSLLLPFTSCHKPVLAV
jgi:hypothetical protein